MMLKAGSFLKSTALLEGTIFEDTLIFIVEYNAKGAIGYVINKVFPRRFNELNEFANSRAFPLYEGGPVDQAHLFFLHRRPEIIKDGLAIGDVYHGGDFKQAIEAIKIGKLSTSDIRIFIGYCGWDTGELEAEIEEGSWIMVGNEDIFG